jgi:chromosomal replication initiation ATPase DnaA
MHDFQVLDIIIATVARVAGLKRPEELKARKRHPALVKLRDTVCFLARKKTGLSYPEIGRVFWGRDHSTILAAVKREQMRLDRQLRHSSNRTWGEWHAFLICEIDKAIEAAAPAHLPN